MICSDCVELLQAQNIQNKIKGAVCIISEYFWTCSVNIISVLLIYLFFLSLLFTFPFLLIYTPAFAFSFLSFFSHYFFFHYFLLSQLLVFFFFSFPCYFFPSLSFTSFFYSLIICSFFFLSFTCFLFLSFCSSVPSHFFLIPYFIPSFHLFSYFHNIILKDSF